MTPSKHNVARAETCMPSFIRPTVWPQCTNVTDIQTDRTTVRQHRANRFTNDRPKTMLFRCCFYGCLCNRAGHTYFHPVVSSSLFFRRLISAVVDLMFTILPSSTHGVALVRIQDAGLKRASRRSLKIQDAKNRHKFVIWAPSHKFVGLYLRN